MPSSPPVYVVDAFTEKAFAILEIDHLRAEPVDGDRVRLGGQAVTVLAGSLLA